MADLVVGLGATKATWSAAFRSYVRDHTQGIAVEVIMDRFNLARLAPSLDVLVVDDIMRTFSRPDIAGVREVGIHLIGLYDGTTGMGRDYLADLGVDVVLPATTSAAELVALIGQCRPARPAGAGAGPRMGVRGPSEHRGAKGRRGLVMAWTKVSGGTGLTEVTVAAAQYLAKRATVLLIEADEVGPVLASRLLRSSDTGLIWAVSRVARGQKVLPEGLSGPLEDGTVGIGNFDVVCGSPGAAQVIPAADLLGLVEEAVAAYDYVLVETSWLVGAPSGRERFSAARAMLATADRAVVLASPDPEGAARLVEWRAAALAAGCEASCWAAFGRVRANRYERSHLSSLLQANTGRQPFAGVWFLPEDATVARARWNAEMVWKGPWLKAVKTLAEAATAKHAVRAPVRPGLSWPFRRPDARNGGGAEVAAL